MVLWTEWDKSLFIKKIGGKPLFLKSLFACHHSVQAIPSSP